MDSSRILVAPGLRTLARPRWRAGLAIALSVVASQPRLWLLGMVGFCLRGGVLLLVLPMIMLPTQVEARLLIGDYLGSTGFTAGFWALIATSAILAAVLTFGILLILAKVELAAFEGLIDDPDAVVHGSFQPIPLTEGARRQLRVRLFAVQVLTFVALMASATPLFWAIGQKSFEEVIRPSSSASIYGRVLGEVGDQLFFFIGALVVIEMLSALVNRELLTRAFAWHGSASSRRLWLLPALVSAAIRPLRSPLRTLGTAAISWGVTAAVLLPAMWAIGIAWSTARGAFLTSVSFSDIGDDIGLIAVALGLSAAFVVGIAATGFASALRAAMWSIDRLS